MINKEMEVIEELRPLLTVYSYNILGSWEEAKDIVQDALLKFALIDTSHVIDKKSYLIKTVINLSINQKNKSKKLKEDYPGEWLPEPVVIENAETSFYRKEILSYSLMVLLEKLNVKQRAVFILKEAFDYDHDEIAQVLGISSDNSRQLLTRAKKQLHDKSSSIPLKTQTEYSLCYLKAIQEGNVKELERLFNEEITVTSDGGGKARAALNPIHGKKSSISLLTGIYNKLYTNIHVEQRCVNHQPAFFYFNEDGKLINCQIFTIEHDQIVSIFFIRNPDKLKSLK